MIQGVFTEPEPIGSDDRAAPARRRPKVMQVVLSLTPGGTERLVVEICQRLRPEFDVAVCCLDDEGAWSADLRAADIEVTALKRKAGFRPGLGRAIARLAEEQGVDVLHCHQYSPFVYGRIAATVARLDPVKDLLTLLDAFAEARRTATWAQLLIVGDGPERARIEERARRHDLAASVRITGFRPDVRALLPAADAYVSSSIS